jgi:hypothetical protein
VGASKSIWQLQWERFRALSWYWQAGIWLLAAPVVVGILAASKPRRQQGRWWAVAVVAGVVWVSAVSGAATDAGEPTNVASVAPSTTTAEEPFATSAPSTTTSTTTLAPTTTVPLTTTTVAAPPRTVAPVQQCTTGYSPCIPLGGDVDCAGGSGNGPRYVSGPVSVDQSAGDIYDLDRDGDGVGCES